MIEAVRRSPADHAAAERAATEALGGLLAPRPTVFLAAPGSIPVTPSGKVRRAARRDALGAGALALVGASDPAAAPA